MLLATMALAVLAASGVAQAIINGESDVGRRHPPLRGGAGDGG
jgi:hypothetical protein